MNDKAPSFSSSNSFFNFDSTPQHMWEGRRKKRRIFANSLHPDAREVNGCLITHEIEVCCWKYENSKKKSYSYMYRQSSWWWHTESWRLFGEDIHWCRYRSVTYLVTFIAFKQTKLHEDIHISLVYPLFYPIKHSECGSIFFPRITLCLNISLCLNVQYVFTLDIHNYIPTI